MSGGISGTGHGSDTEPSWVLFTGEDLSMMEIAPTILVRNGFRLFFYSADGVEPIHVHVEFGDGAAQFWISPVALAQSHGLDAATLRKARALVEAEEALIKDKWNEYFKRPSK